MRWTFYFAAFLSLAGQELVVAQKVKLPNPLVVNGETFINPVYESHDASRLYITHKTGAASLPIAQLPDGLPNRLGYNLSNALSAEEEFHRRQEEAEAQSKIELRKMLEQERAASRRVDIVDQNAARMGQANRYNPSSNPNAGYSSPPRSTVAQPSAVTGEPLTSSDVIRLRMGWGPSPLASAEERARFEASGLSGKTTSASSYQGESRRIASPPETPKRRGGYGGFIYPDGRVIDADGNYAGTRTRDGRFIRNDGSYGGFVYPDGRVIDANGNYRGTQLPDGRFINSDGSYGGLVYPDGRIIFSE